MKPTDVGLPSYLDVKAGDYHTLPQLIIGGMQTIGNDYGVITGRGATGEFSAAMTTIRGSHSSSTAGRSAATGSPPPARVFLRQFHLQPSYVRAADDNTTAADLGLGWAAFRMGVPSTITIDTTTPASGHPLPRTLLPGRLAPLRPSSPEPRLALRARRRHHRAF